MGASSLLQPAEPHAGQRSRECEDWSAKVGVRRLKRELAGSISILQASDEFVLFTDFTALQLDVFHDPCHDP